MNRNLTKHERGEMVCSIGYLIQYLWTFFLRLLEIVSFVASTLRSQSRYLYEYLHEYSLAFVLSYSSSSSSSFNLYVSSETEMFTWISTWVFFDITRMCKNGKFPKKCYKTRNKKTLGLLPNQNEGNNRWLYDGKVNPCFIALALAMDRKEERREMLSATPGPISIWI